MAGKIASDLHAQFHWTQQHQGELAPSKNGRDKLRLELYKNQNGQCHWHQFGKCCMNTPKMSLERVIASPETGRLKQNPLFASFEHLVRKYDGGTSAKGNMVLAHARCNHKREKGLPPNGKKWRHLLPDAHLKKNRSDIDGN